MILACFCGSFWDAQRDHFGSLFSANFRTASWTDFGYVLEDISDDFGSCFLIFVEKGDSSGSCSKTHMIIEIGDLRKHAKKEGNIHGKKHGKRHAKSMPKV